MNHRPAQHAFTLAEMLISMVGSSIIIGALLFSSMQLQKSLHAAERYAANHSDQRRLLDCLARDLRRAVGIASSTSVNGDPSTRLSGATLAVENGTSLALTLPGYYRNHLPGTAEYDQQFPVEAVDNYVDYGAYGSHAAGVSVHFCKEYVATEASVCFIRIEEGVQTIIVRGADFLRLQVAVGADGRTCTVETTYQSPNRTVDARIRVRDEILLRNLRAD